MKKLRIPVATGYRFINPASIVYIEYVNKTTTLFMSGADKKSIISIKGLLFFEKVLKPFGFGRMNKQQVVNHDFIIEQDKMKTPHLTLEGYEKEKISLSAGYKKRHGDYFIG